MDFDDHTLKKSDEITALEQQDLSPMGETELTARISRLKAEISRTEAEVLKRGDSRAAAEALFK